MMNCDSGLLFWGHPVYISTAQFHTQKRMQA